MDSDTLDQDLGYLNRAYKEALKAFSKEEVPVGAVVVKDGQIIAKGHNTKERKKDPCAHAEMNAIKSAAQKLKDWRLDGCTLYSTLEPCPMCAGAILHARIQRVVFGAWDYKWGAAGTKTNLFIPATFNHSVVAQYLEHPLSSSILSDFFRQNRQKK